MVIDNLNISRSLHLTVPNETNAPFVVHANTVLAFPRALQRFQAIAWRHLDLHQSYRKLLYTNDRTMESSTVTFDRRQVYRPFLASLNPASPGTLGNLIVTPEHDPRQPDQPPIHVAFANAAELTRGVQMALVGGIGSGKTTELWLTDKVLKRHEDAINVLIDLAEITDLNGLNPGAALIAVGMELFRKLKKQQKSDEIKTAYQSLRVLATGKTDWVEPEPEEYDPSADDDDEHVQLVPVHTPGLLKPRFPAIQRQVTDVLDLTLAIAGPLVDSDAQITIMIDGLDRLIEPERFRRFVEQDLRALRGTPISIIVAAPLLLWFDKSRFLQDYFDDAKHIPAAISDPAKSDFLKQVLVRRGAGDLMGEGEISEIARFSGGVLRDLITLARTAAEAAYREDKDRIDAEHVRSAVRQLGKRYLLGLGHSQLARIGRLTDNQEFSVDNPKSREMLVNRQVLEYFSDGRDSFAVHPALAEALKESSQ